MDKWKLKQTNQCGKCPWKCSVNPHDIPNGYDVEKHRNLENTIAQDTDWDFSKPMQVMACHNSHSNHCIGWLNHQLNEGNNIKMRIKMMFCENASKMRVFGEQHTRFEDTLPSCSVSS